MAKNMQRRLMEKQSISVHQVTRLNPEHLRVMPIVRDPQALKVQTTNQPLIIGQDNCGRVRAKNQSAKNHFSAR